MAARPVHADLAMRQASADSCAGPLYDQEMRPPAYDGPATRILSWNVAGLRSLLKRVSLKATGACAHGAQSAADSTVNGSK